MTEIMLPAGLERRLEDYGLITGQTHFVDDLRPAEGRPPALYMVVVRSPYAHAVIHSINLDAARALPGVVAAYSGAELVRDMDTLAAFPLPGLKKPERRPLAVGRARYIGDPVAVVLAENIYAAIDARDLVDVDYEPLSAVADPEAALASDAPLLYDEFGSNVAFASPSGGGDIETAFANADRTVRLRLVNQRLAPSSLEPRACMFDFDPQSGQFFAWVSSQAVFRVRDMLAGSLGIDRSNIHVRNAQVGGAFGAKTNFVGEEFIAARLAMQFGQPVKWIEDRSENLQAQTHGRGQINYIEAAFKNDGRVLGLRVRTIADIGAFFSGATAMVPTSTAHMLCGPYQIQAVDSVVIGAFTNKVPTSAYRGAGRPEAAYILERTMDRVARELGMDPAEVRRRNFIAPFTTSYTTVTGMTYDIGNYQATLDKALEVSDYAGWRVKQQERRKEQSSRQLGIGLATYIEITGGGGPARPGVLQESATVRIRRDGTVLVQS
ncbi:MAG TPA: xanthine dehydrogenase family protein molybdopterin-binding subunit, partial [Ktedonobacteraceae bacterium]|nr:xanthine dehydrogenase family protein molybdopterin-binding subunit [Ktedonobacteraceae bacterium]